jgi:hypothetical protein
VDDDVNANAAADSYADIVDTTVTTKLKKLAPELLLKRTTSPQEESQGQCVGRMTSSHSLGSEHFPMSMSSMKCPLPPPG